MKNLALLLLAILHCLIGFAQWQPNGNDIYFNGGNVGIGTDFMNSKFEVLDNKSHFIVNEGYSPTWQSYRAAMGIGYLGAGHAALFIDGVDGDFTGMDYASLIQFNDLSLELSNRSNSQINFGVGGDYFSPEHIKMSILHTGNVGIGTKSPDYSLDVVGDINFTGNFYQNGSLFSGGSDGWIVNGNDMYSTVSGNVGIGTDFPENKFEVFDNNSHLQFNDGYSPTWQSYRAGLSIGYLGNGHAGLFVDGVDGDFTGMDYASLIQFNDLSLELSNRSNSQINFGVGGDYFSPEHIKMSILHTGNVGIGTKEPEAKLQIADGDIFISDINKGIIMKSPDGQCWRGTLDNSGVLNFTLFDCPTPYMSKIGTNEPHQGDFIIFPNPADNKVIVKYDNPSTGKLKYTIFNSLGQILASGKIRSNNQEIDVSGLAPGFYVIAIFDKSGNKLFSEQLIRK